MKVPNKAFQEYIKPILLLHRLLFVQINLIILILRISQLGKCMKSAFRFRLHTGMMVSQHFSKHYSCNLEVQ